MPEQGETAAEDRRRLEVPELGVSTDSIRAPAIEIDAPFLRFSVWSRSIKAELSPDGLAPGTRGVARRFALMGAVG